MKPEHWQQIDKVFHSALERPRDQRGAFLAEACANDESMRCEIEALLAAHEQSGEFLDAPAYERIAASPGSEPAGVAVGEIFGHYKILDTLGAGGMGTVYLAQDTRLGRKIALKLLPSEFTLDSDRVRRFEQEARAASALSHPNVCVIHEIGETDDNHPFIAMEYIEGMTLRQRLAQKPLKLTQSFDVARQIAAGLATAHAAEIIHRDIKPENIMLRTDGLVKVLDFGLAKLTERQTTESDTEALMRSLVKTGSGMIMGTLAYMSPEQARGLAADARTDIWSLGVVLYEMVTGQLPFVGPTPSDLLVAILDREPAPLSFHKTEVPEELERIVRKALRKDAEERYQVVKDLALDLKALQHQFETQAQFERVSSSTPSGGAQAVTPGGGLAVATTGESTATLEVGITQSRSSAEYVVGEIKRHRRGLLLGLILALFLGLAGAARLYFSAGPSKPSLPAMKIVPFTTFPGFERDSAFSPDGNQLAFFWDAWPNRDDTGIYVKTIGEDTLLRLTPKSASGDSPTWSPDGRWIAFARTSYKSSDGGIFKVPATGGSERKLYSPLTWGDQDWIEPGLDWSPDGRWIAFPNKTGPDQPYSIFLLSIESLETRRLTFPGERAGDIYPVFSPDGKMLAFSRVAKGNGDVYVMPAAGGEPIQLTFDKRLLHNLAWSADGREIVFSSNRGGSGWNLWRISNKGGAPESVGPLPENASNVAVARRGNRLAYTYWYGDADIYRIDLSTSGNHLPTRLISSTRIDGSPQYSPDAKKIAFSSDRSGSAEIWICEPDGSNPTQLTSLGSTGNAVDPFWSPDGRLLAFSVAREGAIDIFVMDPEGGIPRRLSSGGAHDFVSNWSRNGTWIYFSSDRSGTWQVWKLAVSGGEVVPVTKNGGVSACESTDGRFIYYTKREDSGIWRIPVEGGEEEKVFDHYKAGQPWVVAAEGILFGDRDMNPPLSPIPEVARVPASAPTINFYHFATKRITRVATLEKSPADFAVSPNGRWLLYSQLEVVHSDIMLLENFR